MRGADPPARRLLTNLVPALPSLHARLLHGDEVAIGGHPWRVIVGYGHAPEHESLFSPAHKVLISGDMVLPRISTNVSVFDHEPDANPLPFTLRSLDRYDDLPADTVVLPSHGRPFVGLHRTHRLAARAIHDERLAEVL